MMKKRQLDLGMILLSVVLATLASCSIRSQRMAKLLQIDSLMEKHPQQAYDSLKSFEKQAETPDPESVTMKYRVLMAEVQNKLYKQMPSDSVFQEVVDYYDNKGTANEKMQAHYLLGCIYRDQEEAPMAIKCYNEAVECADTLSKDCDYITLFSIYGQMADVFADQYLPEEAIGAVKKYSHFALKAGDNYNYVRGQEFCIPYYYMLGDTAKVISLVYNCANMYKKYGMEKCSESIWFDLIDIYINKAMFSQAKSYMDRFEAKSGFFDSVMQVENGRESYYDIKGRYYLAINDVDSAEYYFRKLPETTYRYELARGLLAVYNKHIDVDSIKKYSFLLDNELDKILKKTRTDAVLQSNSLYNYSRLMRVAAEEKYRTMITSLLSIFIFLILMLVFILGFIRYKKMQENKKMEILRLNKEFRRSRIELDQAKQELDFVKSNQGQAVCELENKISTLQSKIQGYQTQYNSMKNAEKEMLLKENAIVASFKMMSSPNLNTPKPTEKDWNSLIVLFEDMLPLLNARIIEKNNLGSQEYKVCILTRLGFSNGEMQVLLQTSSQSITNTKAKVNKKLFDKSGASTLYKNMLDS